jgi:hypothetical protein
MPRSALLAATMLALLSSACSKPDPLPVEKKPEPQAHTELRDAIRQPIDQAKAVDGAVQDAAAKQKADIDAAGG